MFSKGDTKTSKAKYNTPKSTIASGSGKRLRPKSKTPKNNRISSPEVQSITTNSDTENHSIEMNVFLARAKPKPSKSTDITSDDVSEISNSNSENIITETSESTSRSLKLHDTDLKSYRKKLKERFRNVKQTSSKTLGKTSLQKFKTKSRDIISLNNCIESLKNENYNIDQQLKQYHRKQYQYVGNSGEVSSAEKYQFFCESVSPTWNVPEKDTENDQVDRSHDILVIDKRAEGIKEVLQKSYDEMTWMVSDQNVVAEPELTPRNLSEEGLYVTQPPKLRQLYKVQQRLRATESSKWCDTSGPIIFDETNYSGKSYRPDGYAEDASFDVIYQKALLNVPATLSSVTISKKPATLDVNIQSLRFSCHPLFNPEHVLQEELIYHFDKHKDLLRNNKRTNLFERLQALRKSKHELTGIHNSSGDHLRLPGPSDAVVVKQIKSVREELYKECKLYRENTKNILNSWKKLKQLRESSSYSVTAIRLVINKKAQDVVDDFEETLIEIINEKEGKYQKNVELYKRELSEWKKSVETENADDEKEKPAKPPRSTSSKKLRSQLEAQFEESFGSGSEPMLSFSVTYTNEITKLDALSNEEEKQRRIAVGNSKIYLKLFWNDIEICKSKSCRLSDNFTLSFEECLSLKIEEAPQDHIQIQMIQHQGLSKKVLCTIKIQVPKQTCMISQSKHEELSFDQIMETKSGPAKISGFLNYCIGWNSDSETTISETHNANPHDDILSTDGTLNIDKLQEWMETNNPDPEDPRNTIVFDYLQEHQNASPDQATSKYFRCDPYLEPFTICPKEHIEDNIRLQLLQLRDKNKPEFVGMVVPNRLKEIPSNIFVSYKRRLAEERYQEYFEEEDGLDDDIVAKRSMGRKYLRQIHSNVFQICRNCETNLTFEDVVNEKMMPWIQMYIKTVMANFFNWFKLQPALSQPLPLQVQQIEVQPNQVIGKTISKSKAKLVIHLRNGQNLPIAMKETERKSKRKSRSSTADDSTSATKEIIGKYYVEVLCENIIVASGLSSNPAENKNPVWNEVITISLESFNVDYLSPNSLSGNVLLNLFQEIDESEKINSWLGFIEIPISATVSENRLEGCFAIRTPPYLFGYEKEPNSQVSASTPRTQQPNKNLSYIEMSIHTEPIIPKISADLGSIGSSEPPFLRDHILEWNKRFNDDQPRRKFSALGINTNGKTVCITRFVKPLEPPQLNPDGFDVTPEQCARYVSLIPAINNVNKFYQNVWLSAEQMLKLGIGSILDHAVLLTCYLLSLNLEVWLLIGYGLPHGHTAYVLEREYVNETIIPNHYVIDTSTGFKYNVMMDPFCPLQKVYCVVNETNIWGNVQRGDTIATTRFDFTRRFDWQPLFNNQVSSPSNTIQQKLHYLQSGNAHTLQLAIDKKLRKKIAKARTHDLTIWNHYVSNLLKLQISKAEKNFMHNKTHIGMMSEFGEFTKRYKLNGFIEFLPFSSINDIVDLVLQTKTHNITTSNVEFASSVQVHSYTNQIIAMWIAFVAIIKK